MNDRLSALLILLSAAASLASAKLRPFGEAGSEEYSMPPRLTRQPLAPTQYFLHKGRFGLLAPTVRVPVTDNGAAAAAAVRSPVAAAGVGEALNGLNPSKLSGDEGEDRGGFNHGKNPNQFSHKNIEHYFREDYFRGDAKYNLDLCFYLGDDVKRSHVMCNAKWNNNTEEAWNQYINDLAYETNVILNRVDGPVDEKGTYKFEDTVQNYDFKLRWAGPWYRSDYKEKYPQYAKEDTIGALKSGVGCDIVVFLIFNEFESCAEGGSDGHQFSGIAEGGVCEGTSGSGYVIAVDQGYLGDQWVGPQVLAHHLLLVMTQDLYATQGSKEKRGCLNPKSILHESVFAGDQWRDACVESKLRRSRFTKRSCVKNPNYCPDCPKYLDKQDF